MTAALSTGGSVPVARPRLALRRVGLAGISLAVATLLGFAAAPAAEGDVDVRVVASIKPVHSLVSAVMAGVGEPHLLVRGAMSPHTFSLRPSDAAVLQNADVVFLIGESMETSLARPIDTLAGDARVIALSEAEGLVHRPLREGGTFETHAHGADDDHDGDEHHEGDEHHDGDGHDEGDESRREGHEGEEHHEGDDEAHGSDGDHEAGHGVGHEDEAHSGEEDATAHRNDADVHDDDHHEHGAFDMHVWLDPVNGAAMARAIGDALSEADPANAGAYAANTRTLLARLETLTTETAAQVSPARNRPFIVFHDAYRHFEDRFGLTAVGSIVVDPGRSPGVRRISGLRDKVRALGATCVFAEPQFESRFVDVIIEGTSTRVGTVDPLGASIESGPDLYFTLIRDMAESFTACLAPAAGQG